MVVALIDDGDVDASAFQTFDDRQAAEARSDDHDAVKPGLVWTIGDRSPPLHCEGLILPDDPLLNGITVAAYPSNIALGAAAPKISIAP